MTPPGNESETPRDLLGDLEDEVDYESDTIFMGPDGSPLPHLRVKTTLVVRQIRSQNVVLRTRLLRYAPRLT